MRIRFPMTVLSNGAVAVLATVSGTNLLAQYLSTGGKVHFYAGIGFCVLAVVNVLAAIGHRRGEEPELRLWRITLVLACTGITFIIVGLCSAVFSAAVCARIRLYLALLTLLFCVFVWYRPKFKNVALFISGLALSGLFVIVYLFAQTREPGSLTIGAGALITGIGLVFHRRNRSFYRLNRNDIVHLFFLAGLFCIYRGIYLLTDYGP